MNGHSLQWFLSAWLLAFALVLPSTAKAHEDGPDPEELAIVYKGMLESIRELDALARNPGASPEVTGAFTTALFRFLALYEKTVKAECPECEVREITKVDPTRLRVWRGYAGSILKGLRDTVFSVGTGAATVGVAAWRVGQMDVKDIPGAFAAWLGHVGKIGVGATGEISTRYGFVYALIWAVATASFEILEHGPLQLHVGCAAFQTVFNLGAGFVWSFYRLGLNPTGDANYLRRLWNVFPANYYEWKFWWRLSSFFTKVPHLVVEEEEKERRFQAELTRFAKAIEKELSGRSFSADALAYFTALEPGRAAVAPWTPKGLLADLEIVFSETAPTREKRLVAWQQAEALRSLFLEPLRSALKQHAKAMTFPQYFRLKRLAGSLGRLIDEYALNLAAAAGATVIANRESKQKAMGWVLGEIVALFQREDLPKLLTNEFPIEKSWYANFMQLFRQNDSVAEIRREVARIRAAQFELRRGKRPPEEVPCSRLLDPFAPAPLALAQ